MKLLNNLIFRQVPTILENKYDISQIYENNKGTIKRMKISEYPDIEVSLLNWFLQCRDLNVPINR